MSEENITPPQEEIQEYQQEQLTVTEAMSGVISVPGETYETIAATEKKNYWLIPIIIAIVLGLISSFIFMQDKELTSKVMDKQKAKMMERFEKNIKEGKMTQEQANNAMESINPEGTMFKIIGYGGAALGPFIILFILGLIYFIALKVLKSEAGFTDVLNVVGLAYLIIAIGNLIATVISVIKGDLGSLSLGLLLSEESVGSKVYTMISKLDVFSIWFYTVVAIGITKIGRISMAKSVIFVFGIWIIFYVVIISLIF
ncbi:MAG: YIP1 family protein [Bacteroidetes bacterium]|nr:YIP1 family protein [Bacteroidota bacterium]